MSFNTFVTDTFVTKVIVCRAKVARTRVNAFLYASIINKTQITTHLVTFGGSVLKTIINQDICDTIVTSAYDIIMIIVTCLISYQQRQQFCLE